MLSEFLKLNSYVNHEMVGVYEVRWLKITKLKSNVWGEGI